MRHQRRINSLSRTSSHRKAMFANMASSLIKHKRIFTTLAKAKALRGYVEPLITKSKNDTTHSRRVVFSYLADKEAVNELFREVSVKVADRPGGYTRIIKTGKRLGDNAEMAMIELVDFNENLLQEKAAKETSTRKRSRRGSTKKKATEETAAPAPVAEVVDEAVEEVAEKAEEVVEEVAEQATESTEAEVTAEAEDNAESSAEEKPEEKAEDSEAEEK